MSVMVEASDLARIAEDIWTAVLGLPLEDADGASGHDAGVDVVTGQVQITGVWNGVVSVELGWSLARTAATAMFGAEDIDDDEVRDVVGELANMTGGNVKAQLDGPHALSLPTVTSGASYRITLPGTREIERVVLRCGDDLVLVTVLEGGGQ